MILQNINILLADDDNSDCLLFKDALEELPLSANPTFLKNGEQVMAELTKNENKLPDFLFPDLNMSRKNGFATLRDTRLQELPLIVFSTSSEMYTGRKVFRDAAHYYICKPIDFSKQKKVLYESFTLVTQNKNNILHLKDNFMITGALTTIPDKE